MTRHHTAFNYQAEAMPSQLMFFFIAALHHCIVAERLHTPLPFVSEVEQHYLGRSRSGRVCKE